MGVRRQANLIAAWGIEDPPGTLSVFVRNSSELPVVEVRAELEATHSGLGYDAKLIFEFPVVGPSNEATDHQLVAPDNKITNVRVWFTDSDRRTWVRDYDQLQPREQYIRGQLRRVGIRNRLFIKQQADR
jgi:hypothetical protein